MRVRTATATIGIRGTGFYVESAPDQTYFCTCYGVTDIAASSDPESRDTVLATHHDRPVYIVANAAPGKNIRNAGSVINHTDQELALTEALVGRGRPSSSRRTHTARCAGTETSPHAGSGPVKRERAGIL